MDPIDGCAIVGVGRPTHGASSQPSRAILSPFDRVGSFVSRVSVCLRKTLQPLVPKSAEANFKCERNILNVLGPPRVTDASLRVDRVVIPHPCGRCGCCVAGSVLTKSWKPLVSQAYLGVFLNRIFSSALVDVPHHHSLTSSLRMVRTLPGASRPPRWTCPSASPARRPSWSACPAPSRPPDPRVRQGGC
jgi:hypothetical protein